jgi:tRNA dimethylallyltransferase
MSAAHALPKLLVIVGPTASGKTDLAIALARQFGGEVVSVDSRQLYRGMRIGAGVVEGEWKQRGKRRMYVAQGVPHHMVLRYSPSHPLTLAQYRRAALWHIRDITRRGKLPILVGGTGLYIRAIVDNFDVPKVAPDPAFRAALDGRSTGDLFAELQKKDSVYAARITASNRRYITRALEVIAATDEPFSAQHRARPPLFDVLQLGIQRPKEEVDRLIAERVHKMVELGLIAEVRRLAKHYGWEAGPMTGLGYRQLRGLIEGRASLSECLAQSISETRQYAKRQRTWFRRDQRIVWVGSAAAAGSLIRQWLG